MRSRETAVLVFVSHPVAGVRRIPEAWLDGYAPSGFRRATRAEIRRWHADRALDPLLPRRAAPSDSPSPGSPSTGAAGAASDARPSHHPRDAAADLLC